MAVATGPSGMRDATALINEEANAKGINYILEDTADGWEPKALASRTSELTMGA